MANKNEMNVKRVETKKVIGILIGMTLLFIAGIIAMFVLNKQTYEMYGIGNKEDYVFSYAIYGEDGTKLKNPIDISISQTGIIYIVDSENNRVQMYNTLGNFIGTFGKKGTKDGEFDYPVGVDVNSRGEVFVADLNNARISVFDSRGKFNRNIELKEIGHKGPVAYIPTALAIGPSDEIYFVDKIDQSIKMIDLQGYVQKTFGSYGEKQGQIKFPLGIDVDMGGNIYVSDTGNDRIQVFNSDGYLNQELNKQVSGPSGIAVDREGRIHIVNSIESNVNVWQPNRMLDTFIGKIGEDFESFYVPEGIEVTDEFMVIADKGNNRVVVYKKINNR